MTLLAPNTRVLQILQEESAGLYEARVDRIMDGKGLEEWLIGAHIVEAVSVRFHKPKIPKSAYQTQTHQDHEFL